MWVSVPAWLWEVLTPALGESVAQSTADFVESRRLELATRVARRDRTNGLVLLASVLALVHGVLETLGHWPSLVHAESFAPWTATVVLMLTIYGLGLRRRADAAAELARLDALDL